MMMEKKLAQSLRLLFAGGMMAGVGLAAAPVSAQEADSGASIQRVEITGSNIRRADKETPSPVQVITAADMAKSGLTSVADVLHNLTANGQGTLSQSFSGAFASGASGIALRGLTVGATLVLIDGHRMAPFPLSDDGQRAFVDISNIPFDAVERIEILKDGASATYGSDAIAGVVNVILKKNVIGTKLSAEAGTTTKGGGTTTHASASHGFGDLDRDGFNAFGTLEVRKQEKITLSQRQGSGQWSSFDYTALGGRNRTPGVPTASSPSPITLTPFLTNPDVPTSAAGTAFYPGPCNYDLRAAGGCAYVSPYSEISPATQNINLLGSFTKKLSEGWKANLTGSFFDSKAEQYNGSARQTFPQSFTPNVAISAGVIPHPVGETIGQISVPANYPGNPFGVPALVNGFIPDIGATATKVESQATRLVGSVSGSYAGWDIDSSLGYTKVTTKQDVLRSVNVPALNTALNRPTSPFLVTGGNSASDLATIFPNTSAKDTSELTFAELRGTRSIMTLAGGDLGVSIGSSFTRRVLNAPAPDLIAQGIVAGNNAYAQGSQNDTAFYAELVAPVLKSLELDGALRYDRYSRNISATTPKVGFKFTPVREFAVRGTYSEGFRAPNPAENGQAGQAYLADNGNDPVLCPGGLPSGSGNIAAGSVIAACDYQATYLNSSTPDLKPEKSKSYTLGLILEPIRGWSTTIDYYRIKISNQIIPGTPSDTPVRADPVQSLLADGNGGSYTGTPAVGPVLYYPNGYINANSTKTTGVDLETSYKFKLKEFGTLSTSFQISHMMSYLLTTADGTFQLAGTHGPFITSGDTGNPKNRATANVTWDQGPLQVSATVNWISSFDLTDPSYGLDNCAAGAAVGRFFPKSRVVPSNLCKVASFVDTDVSARYKLPNHWTLHGSVTNLFNRQPPVDLNTYGGGLIAYNPSLHSVGAVGRFINVGASYEF